MKTADGNGLGPRVYFEVAGVDAVVRAGMLEVEANGAAVLLYDVAGTIYATAAVCPHQAAWFSQGGMEGEFVDCPRHQGRFHIPTGRKVRGPDCPPVRTFPVRIEAGRVFVEIEV